MAFIKFIYKPKNELESGGRLAPPPAPEEEPGRACPNCRRQVPLGAVEENMGCCPECGWHFRLSARKRIALIADEGSFAELWPGLSGEDILAFPGYAKKLESTRASSGEREGVVCGEARIGGWECCLFVMEPGFMMGSMGAALGEKVTRTFEHAVKKRLPVVGFTVSGGARMQEGIVSLMQMAKTSGAVKLHSDAGLLYITVLTDPTTGGVTASFAMEGDIILAEPGATVGFAGARVIEQTTRKKLPEGFQTAESMLRHGFVDAIVPRAGQKKALADLLKMHKGGGYHG